MENGQAYLLINHNKGYKMNLQTYYELVNPSSLKRLKVYVGGLGNGGSSLVYYLFRSGFSNFVFDDIDIVEERNLYGHLCSEDSLGMLKVDAVKKELLKRNPQATIKTLSNRYLESDSWQKEVLECDIVLIATDNMASRFILSDFCVEHKKPMLVGKVFHEGIGGEVFSYIPGVSGCLNCLELFLGRIDRKGIAIEDHMTDEEKNDIYAKNITDIKDAPGLYLDMAFIPLLMARKVLEVAYYLNGNISDMTNIPNYLVWSNHAVRPFKKALNLEKFFLEPQEACTVCNCAEDGE